MIPDFKTYIGESVWNDIRRRGNGTERKKEDNIDFLSLEDFCTYLKTRYKIDNSQDRSPQPSEIKCVTQFLLSVPLFAYNGKNVNNVQDSGSFEYYPDENAVGFGCSSRALCCKRFFEKLGERFNDPKNGIKFDIKNRWLTGNIRHSTLVEMIDFAIDNMEKPLIPLIVRK